MKRTGRLLSALLAMMMLAGCGYVQQESAGSSSGAAESQIYGSAAAVENADIEDEATALAAAPAVMTSLEPVASGTLVEKNDKAEIDYSNTTDGYVMVRHQASTKKRLKVQVKGPSDTTYTYNINCGSTWTTFVLSDGNGSYKVTVYENISGTKYATVLSKSFTVSMTNSFAPFLRPNQYVNYTSASKTTAKAAALTKGMTDPLDKVKAVYDFVVSYLTYDKEKAATVKSGYLPVLDTVLAEKKGICFDYASLMTAMLRSQGVPCKLIVGYAGTAYHAWINVYTKEDGWINAAIYFDGKTWKLMDPTFASSGKQSAEILKYIGNGANYTAKYIY
jgi:Transglutaminase-like enzymes, putative cysteine proteases